ncbi:hypothetical protein A2U01_0116996, partial [Trifolium medium]|nr:hypothetical protein [Trifolium medium]
MLTLLATSTPLPTPSDLLFRRRRTSAPPPLPPSLHLFSPPLAVATHSGVTPISTHRCHSLL